ncbi:hypothetical protein BH11BAC6_BH11BAC6_03580 [soil metagenome]
MKGVIKVVTQAEYDEWMAKQKPAYYVAFPEKDPSATPSAPVTDTTKGTAVLLPKPNTAKKG